MFYIIEIINGELGRIHMRDCLQLAIERGVELTVQKVVTASKAEIASALSGAAHCFREGNWSITIAQAIEPEGED